MILFHLILIYLADTSFAARFKFDWSTKSYDEFCDHSDESFSYDPYWTAIDESTGLIWMVSENDDCNITIRHYDPETDTVIEDADRSTLIGDYGSAGNNPNHAAIVNSVIYLIETFGDLGHIDLTNPTIYNKDLTDVGSGIFDVCIAGDNQRGLLYILDEWNFWIYDIENNNVFDGPYTNNFHLESSCVFDYETNLLYVIGGMSPYIETINIDTLLSSENMNNNTIWSIGDNSLEWTTLSGLISDGYSIGECDFRSDIGPANGIVGATSVMINDNSNKYIVIMGGECTILSDWDCDNMGENGCIFGYIYTDTNKVVVYDINNDKISGNDNYNFDITISLGKGVYSNITNKIYYMLGSEEGTFDYQRNSIMSSNFIDTGNDGSGVISNNIISLFGLLSVFINVLL